MIIIHILHHKLAKKDHVSHHKRVGIHTSMNSNNVKFISKKLSEMKIDYLKSTIFHEIIYEFIGKYELGGPETF